MSSGNTMAKRHGLTAIAVENAKPGGGRREISDGRGLFLVVQPSGGKSWAVRYRFNGKPAKLTLGKWPQVSLATARKLAADARHQVDKGGDPAGAKRQARLEQRDREADTVEHLAAQCIEQHAKRKTRSWRATERLFKTNILPPWSGRTVHDIRKRDVIHLVEAIAADRPRTANLTFAHIRKFFGWLVERDILLVSPCQGVKAPARENPRDRVLTDDEITAYWNAADGEPLAQLLLLTGQRRGEVAGMRWSEINEAERAWTLPGDRTKNGQTHVIPLSRQAWKIIAAMSRIIGDDHVLAATGDRKGYDRIKKRLEAKIETAAPWQLHDVRRTVATGLQRLGVRLEVTEAVLNHTSGSRAGIVGIYQRHDWKEEKAAALQRWADHVEALVTGKPAARVIRLAQSG